MEEKNHPLDVEEIMEQIAASKQTQFAKQKIRTWEKRERIY